MAEIPEIVDSVGKTLGQIFRHLLPGIMIVGAAYFSYPDWFEKVDLAKNQWLIVLGAIAIVAGNVWLVFHRYLVQQVVDYLFYWADPKGSPGHSKNSHYPGAVADHVSEFFWNVEEKPDLARHIRFRASSVVLMYIASEVAIVLGSVNPGNCLVGCDRWLMVVLGVAGFLASVCQNFIVRRIEGKIVSSEI